VTKICTSYSVWSWLSDLYDCKMSASSLKIGACLSFLISFSFFTTVDSVWWTVFCAFACCVLRGCGGRTHPHFLTRLTRKSYSWSHATPLCQPVSFPTTCLTSLATNRKLNDSGLAQSYIRWCRSFGLYIAIKGLCRLLSLCCCCAASGAVEDVAVP